jgi:hypothetical protein
MKKNKLEEKILSEIRTNKVKMKPKWWFDAVDRIEKSSVALLLLSGAVLIGISFYIFILIDPRELISYGNVGMEVLLENISYSKFLAGLILGITGGFIFSKIGTNYKISHSKILLMAGSILVMLAAIMIVVRNILEL